MSTFYIVDDRTNEIVNAVETDSQSRADFVASRMRNAEHLRATERPTHAQLLSYRYWDERP